MPWLAALVLGASAHAGYLIHELREHGRAEAPTIVVEASGDLDLWIHQSERYLYTIDRRALEQVTFADYHFADLERLGAIVERLGFVEPIELRNIRRGTPLYLLGLRNGDRLLAISTRGEPEFEHVALAIERRGRRLAMIYEIV